MPYPREQALSKHDIASPSTISISSGRLEPLFDSKETIIKQVQSTQYHLRKLALSPVYTYKDAPLEPRPLSRTLYISGFCDLSSIVPSTAINTTSGEGASFDRDSMEPFDGMKICHVTVKRADKESLEQKHLDNSNKFTHLCENLSTHSKAALIQCPKTDRAGFLIPMKNHEDGYRYAAYFYIGDKNVVEQMISSLGVTDSDEVVWKPEDNDESDEVTWKPPEDNDEIMWNPEDNNAGNDSNNLWKPPGSGNDDNNGDDSNGLWQPPTTNGGGGNDNETENLWQAPETENLWQAPEYNNDGNGGDTTMMNNSAGNQSDTPATFHSNKGAAAADEFYSNLTRTLSTRSESILYHMRNFNGWVKATQIAELDPSTTFSPIGNSNKKRKRSRHPLRILDLACGKGGDLGKWVLHNRGVQSYVGSDVARGSLVDAAVRARKMKNQLKNRCTFICADLGHDVPGRPRNKNSDRKMQKLLSWSLQNDNNVGDPVFTEVRGGGIQPNDKFDVVSIQFAIHYMMQTEKRARRFFQTVSELLDIGGNLIATTIDARVVIDHMMNTGHDFHLDEDGDGDGGNKSNEQSSSGSQEFTTIKVGKDACQLKFNRDIVKKIFHSTSNGHGQLNSDLFGLEYTFTLVEGEDHAAGVGSAVDLPEWLTPIPVLKQLAEEAGMVMEYASNFHEFYEQRKDPQIHRMAHNALYNMNVLNWRGSISEQEWDISRMYMAVKFRKERESTMVLDDDDVDDDDDNDDEEMGESSQNEPSPAPSAPSKAPIDIDMTNPAVLKLYTKAMAKARMSYTGDWKGLDSDEKKALIGQVLVTMM